MGLFSFIKNAGSKLFKKKAAPAEEKSAEMTKADTLKAEVNRLGLPVSDLAIEFSEQITVSGTTDTNANREKIILTLGNVDGVGCVDDNITVTNPEPESRFYTVQSGDSLSKISKAMYGDPMKYKQIFAANTNILKNPDVIHPDQVLVIPNP